MHRMGRQELREDAAFPAGLNLTISYKILTCLNRAHRELIQVNFHKLRKKEQYQHQTNHTGQISTSTIATGMIEAFF